MKLAYLTYPYSDNPEKRTREIEKIARKLAQKNKDILPIVPHFTFDWIVKDKQKPTLAEHLQVCEWEIEIIKRCDMLVLCHKLDYSISSGMIWEYCIAKHFNKPIKRIEEFLGEE